VIPSFRVRPARADEMPACAEIWRAGLDGYGERIGRPPMASPPETLVGLLGHLRGTDPARFLVAEPAGGAAGGTPGGAAGGTPGGAPGATGGPLAGFVSALRRGDAWYLAMLFVHPGAQARGLGRGLLEAVLPAPGDVSSLATCTDSAQPISNALYARYGIVPRLPVLELVGRPDRAPLPDLPEAVRAVPFELLAGGPPDGPGPRRLAAAVDAMDRGILGYTRPEDHAYLAASGRLGYLYEAGDGRIVGYGYAMPAGRVGPIAVEDEALLPGVLGHLLGAVTPVGAFSAWVPGAAGRGVTALLEAGLRIEDFPALLCWDRPFADLSRYVPISLAVL
jgi:GNAT superfamily N-acetyltransferase